MNNPIKLNDGVNSKYFIIVFVFQIAIWGIICFDFINFQIPLIRQIIGFIYITFIPGSIIVRLLKLKNLNITENLLYIVGLSITTLLLLGLLLNTILPYFGIFNPISLIPLLISISLLVTCLSFLSYFLDKNFSIFNIKDTKKLFSSTSLFFCLLPLISIFGTYFVNSNNNNILLLFLIIIITLIVLSIGFGRFITKSYYPLAIYTIAVSLLYHRSLITSFLTGWDIQHEYFLSNLVTTNSFWDPSIPYMTNGMLSINMLAPIYSIIIDLNLIWIFKIIYPFLFAFVPIGLYIIYKKQTNGKIAFLSCFFFISFPIFFTEMLGLARQQIAELFLVLLILLMINKNINIIKKSFLSIFFAFSLIVSHYGLSYIFMFSLIFASIIFLFPRYLTFKLINGRILNILNKYITKLKNISQTSFQIKNTILNPSFVILFIILQISWNTYVAQSASIYAVTNIGREMTNSIITEFLTPTSTEGLGIITGATTESLSLLHQVTRYLHLITLFFIAMGIVATLIRKDERKIDKGYASFSYIYFFIGVIGVILPHFASSLNTTRLYQITLIFLSPFCIIGSIFLFNILKKIVRSPWEKRSMNSISHFMAIFLIIFFLFTSGFIYHIANDDPTSMALNSELDGPKLNELEYASAKWLQEYNYSNKLYADEYRSVLLDAFFLEKAKVIPKNFKNIQQIFTIYFGSKNSRDNQLLIEKESKMYMDTFQLASNSNNIYSNSGGKIYLYIP